MFASHSIKPLLAIALLAAAGQAEAALQQFSLQYSGAEFGNAAVAFGTLTIDDQVLDNPSSASNWLYLGDGQAITDLTLTVSGAVAGNGSFGLADYDYVSWDSAGATLDLSQAWLGQTTANAIGWGSTTDGQSGDFSFWANAASAAPSAAAAFVLATNNGLAGSEQLRLVAVQPVPLPGMAWLFAGASLGLLRLRRK